MVLDTSVRQVDETLRPDEYLKMAASMNIDRHFGKFAQLQIFQ